MTKYQKNKRISSNKATIRFFLGLCLAIVILTVVISFAPSAKAQFFKTSQDEEKNEFTQKARERNYIGGADEDELKVLAQLPKAKGAKTAENSEGF
jgi:HD-like signal output (HDOD) protein